MEADYNPVGSYIKTFELDEGPKGKKISIRFDGAEQAMYVWLNGHFIGYSEDSFTPAEFDLTDYLEKENILAVEVHKRSTAAFLEDQDFFRFFGIFRDVVLVGRTPNYLNDLWIRPTLHKNNISGAVDIQLFFEDVEKGAEVSYVIADPDDRPVCQGAADITERCILSACVEKYIRVDHKRIEFPTTPENNKYSNHEYAECIDIEYVFATNTVPSTRVEVNWHVEPDGKITVHFYYHGKKGLPELPLLGMRFIMPTKACGFEYKGLSGETYPDRMAGSIPGVYQVEGLPVSPYLVPQDCGMHMDTEWVRIKRNSTLNKADYSNEDFSLRFEKETDNFAFSSLPFTAEELENAKHQEELPPERRTVLLILAKVRGVGGIDSWGADVEKPYHVSAEQDCEFSFTIQ